MAIAEALLPEFDQEAAGVRRTLERVPADKFEWRPHEKSGTMIWLAGHLANLPQWAKLTMEADELDMAPGGEQMPPPPTPASVEELVATFDRHAAEARGRHRRGERRRLHEAMVAAEQRHGADDPAQGRRHP